MTALVWSCVPPTEEVLTEVRIDFTDPLQQKVYDFQDRGLSDSLYPYFRHANPTLRYLAVMAFASLRDSAAVDSLIPVLRDPVEAVRIGAAYALGQIGSARAEQPLTEAFQRFDTAGVARYFNAAILEAIGKCGGRRSLDAMATVSTYQPTDTVLLEGQCWGIYRFALRGLTLPEGTSRMLKYATSGQYPPSVRFIAANYLMRAKDIDLGGADIQLAPALPREDDPRTRMALAVALGRTGTQKALNALMYQYNLEQDYRVRVNILRALKQFDYATVKPLMLQALKDEHPGVALTAAAFFVEKGIAEDGSLYWQLAKEPYPWEVQMKLYKAASLHIPLTFEESRKYLNWELKRILETSTNPYQKAAALEALAGNGWNYRYIRDVGFLFDSPVVRTASVQALAEIASRPDFNRYFGASSRVKEELSDFFVEAIQTADPGMVSVAATVLRNPALKFKNTIDSLDVLKTTLQKLTRPQDIEAYIELHRTIDFLEGKEPNFTMVPHSDHRIDWKRIAALKPQARVLIRTARGEIALELLPQAAPGTVANFLELIESGYYTGKNFHRVVPNFVIQGGCNRGDGYGSLEYTIRSELPYLHYDREGMVGMASAGNHTESQQFFITHSPAPHLDGNYTLFARVVSGMDVVHQTRLGDVIEEVLLVEKMPEQ
ncbi:MAG: hypothetical protein KatS3mg029_0080 [Saprospiraceae bacterium]|nr:MAG: hypothetical protein KatS3mg029_0080 [Saprospiraceae bacterium]